MWIYHQSTGELYDRLGSLCGVGYSGAGSCKNDPAAQFRHNLGPIPQGSYKIGDPHDTDEHGPFVLDLTPGFDNVMKGRSEFKIHGERLKPPAGEASEGCIILDRAIREKIAASEDRLLEVVA